MQFSIIIHLINPIIASVITFFFIFLLQDLLLLDFIFEDAVITVVSFVVLCMFMIVTSIAIPRSTASQD